MSIYPYASGDLLDDRNTYFYTEYKGMPFLQAWKKNREEIANKLPQNSCVNESKIGITPKDLFARMNEGHIVKTDLLLKSIYHSLPVQADAMVFVDMFVKKFEITKRIYSSYGKGFKPTTDRDYRQLTLYVGASEIFDKAYSMSGDLRYLNALLKCIDTLCALEKDLDMGLKARLKNLIFNEKKHVMALSKTVKVDL